MKRYSATIFLLLTTLTLIAGQPSQAVLDYIEQYKEIAVNEMIEFRIPASITLAQGILESGAGQSELAKKSNNHFGIKCHSDWTGDKVYYDDDAKDECFRKYDDVADSYRDHSEFLSKKGRYASLFELDPDDYKGWAKGLKEAGYATNPKYADMLINLIEEYELNKLDKMSLAEVKKNDKKVTAENENKKDEKETAQKNNQKDKSASDKKADKKEDRFKWGGYSEEVYYYNRIPTINIKQGDTPEKLANDHRIKLSLLKDYNDIENGGELVPGTKFYLQPKRKKGSTKYHVVKEGETMWIISREEGVRLGYLYKYNYLEPGQEPATGEEINLRSKRKDEVKLKSEVGSKKEEEKKPPVVNPQSSENKTDVIESNKEERIEEKEAMKIEVKEQDIFIEDVEEETELPKEESINKPVPEEEIKSTPAEKTAETKISMYHTVAAKETLYALSKQYKVSIEELQLWNSLPDNSIKIGQQLIVGFK
ncbi:MAG: glucosaminidase domain-containing protein [Chitinophagales bacterium]